MSTKTLILALLLLITPAIPQSVPASPHGEVILSQSLPAMDGAHLTVKLVEVDYPAQTGSSPHSHPCPVIGYVVNGTIQSQVKGGDEQAYPAGKTFYEPPNGVHQVSGNKTAAPAKLLAIFICDKDVPLSHPAN